MTTPPWEPLGLDDAIKTMLGFPAPWWIAGGWAIDLFVERQTREHDNVDVVVLGNNPLADAPDGLDVHFAGHAEELVYAGPDEALRLPLAELVLRNAEGVPYLRPELVLLHKARELRLRDGWDFEVALPLLNSDARAWLHDRLPRDHAWRLRL